MVWLVTDGGGQTSKHKWRDTVNYIMCHANHAIRGYYDNMHTTVDTVSQELSRFCQCLFLLNVIEISNQPTIWALDLRRENSQWWWTVVDNSTMCTAEASVLCRSRDLSGLRSGWLLITRSSGACLQPGHWPLPSSFRRQFVAGNVNNYAQLTTAKWGLEVCALADRLQGRGQDLVIRCSVSLIPLSGGSRHSVLCIESRYCRHSVLCIDSRYWV